MISRRTFVQRSAVAAAASSLGIRSAFGLTRDPAARLEDAVWDAANTTDFRALAAKVLDAARSTGASYADVRFTMMQQEGYTDGWLGGARRHIATGVRVLVNGVWGFVSIPTFDLDYMARAGREAVGQTRNNNWGFAPGVELSAPPPAANGTWVMPVDRDPFTVPVEEKIDYFVGLMDMAKLLTPEEPVRVLNTSFTKQERIFASTDGAFNTQTLFASSAAFKLGNRFADILSSRGMGFEVITDAGLEDYIPRMWEDVLRSRNPIPVDIGKYEVVFDASAMANIIHGSIGFATEADRARGFEANAGGTSYLPLPDSLGTSLGSPAFGLTGTRRHKGGLSTVKWDDEGVEPTDFPIVSNGELVDYATSREHVAPLRDWYTSRNMPLVSHGCANSETAMDIPLVYAPDLQLTPASTDVSLDAMIADVKRGYFVMGGNCVMDHQQVTGQGVPNIMFEIRNGKVGKAVEGGAFLFRSSEFWRDLTAVGGPNNVQWFGFGTQKGQPGQRAFHSVGAVPARVKDMRVVNLMTGR